MNRVKFSIVLLFIVILCNTACKKKCSGNVAIITISNPSGNLYEVRMQIKDLNGDLHTASNFTQQGGISEELSIPEGKSRVYAIYKTAVDFKTIYVDADLKACQQYVATANSNAGSFYLNVQEK